MSGKAKVEVTFVTENLSNSGRWIRFETGYGEVCLRQFDVVSFVVYREEGGPGRSTHVHMRGGSRVDLPGDHSETLSAALFIPRGT